MIVVPPITVTDSTMTNNIPEPDTGETVWAAKSYTDIVASSYELAQLTHDGSDFYAVNKNDETEIITTDGDFASPSVFIDLTGQGITYANGITFDGTYFWVRSGTPTAAVWRYTDAGVYDSFTFSAPNETNNRGMVYNGNSNALAMWTGSTSNEIALYGLDGVLIDGSEWPLDSANTFCQDLEFDGEYYYISDFVARKIFKYTEFGELVDSVSYLTSATYSRGIGFDGTYLRVSDRLSPQTFFKYYQNLTRGDNYQIGDEVINTTTHLSYLCATPNTVDPTVGVDSTPPSWTVSGSSNKYKMFNQVIGTTSSRALNITVDFDAGELVNAIACFNIIGDTANVTMVDPVEGEVYNRDIDLNDYSQVIDYYEYFFEPIANRSAFALFDLPPYPNATITLTVDDAATAEIGECVIGQQRSIGVANYGSGLGLVDFSRKITDEFGNVTTEKRRNSKTVDYDVTIDTTAVSYAYNTLSGLTTTPCVYAGSAANDDTLLVYGYYEDMRMVVEYPTKSSYTLNVQSLI